MNDLSEAVRVSEILDGGASAARGAVHAEHQRVHAALVSGHGLAWEAAPEGLRERTLERLAGARVDSGVPRQWGWAVAAGVAMAAGLTFVVLRGGAIAPPPAPEPVV